MPDHVLNHLGSKYFDLEWVVPSEAEIVHFLTSENVPCEQTVKANSDSTSEVKLLINWLASITFGVDFRSCDDPLLLSNGARFIYFLYTNKESTSKDVLNIFIGIVEESLKDATSSDIKTVTQCLLLQDRTVIENLVIERILKVNTVLAKNLTKLCFHGILYAGKLTVRSESLQLLSRIKAVGWAMFNPEEKILILDRFTAETIKVIASRKMEQLELFCRSMQLILDFDDEMLKADTVWCIMSVCYFCANIPFNTGDPNIRVRMIALHVLREVVVRSSISNPDIVEFDQGNSLPFTENLKSFVWYEELLFDSLFFLEAIYCDSPETSIGFVLQVSIVTVVLSMNPSAIFFESMSRIVDILEICLKKESDSAGLVRLILKRLVKLFKLKSVSQREDCNEQNQFVEEFVHYLVLHYVIEQNNIDAVLHLNTLLQHGPSRLHEVGLQLLSKLVQSEEVRLACSAETLHDCLDRAVRLFSTNQMRSAIEIMDALQKDAADRLKQSISFPFLSDVFSSPVSLAQNACKEEVDPQDYSQKMHIITIQNRQHLLEK